MIDIPFSTIDVFYRLGFANRYQELAAPVIARVLGVDQCEMTMGRIYRFHKGRIAAFRAYGEDFQADALESLLPVFLRDGHTEETR